MTANVTAIVTAFRRIDEVLNTLRILRECEPAPAEILVHVDGGEHACADRVRAAFPSVRVIVSDDRVGPGGGRNKMVAAASHEIVASFDDDSYPMDADFFGRVIELFAGFPDAWVVAGKVFHRHQPLEPPQPVAEWSADFSGGACAYRRPRYLDVGGYVPLPDAYNMEEIDFALRTHARGGKVLVTPWLRVFHDTDLARHNDPVVTAASIANLALLAFLRYPVYLWPVGAGQCANRLQWLMRNGRQRGIVAGLAGIPMRLWRHRHHRDPLPAAVVRSYLGLRRRPVSAALDAAGVRAH